MPRGKRRIVHPDAMEGVRAAIRQVISSEVVEKEVDRIMTCVQREIGSRLETSASTVVVQPPVAAAAPAVPDAVRQRRLENLAKARAARAQKAARKRRRADVAE